MMNLNAARILSNLLALALLSGCSSSRSSEKIEPTVQLSVQKCDVERKGSAFSPLSGDEKKTEWGRELMIADRFAREMDLYRAVTSYKRAAILAPPEETNRRWQIDFGIVQSYYLAGKYCEAVNSFEESSLTTVNKTFPALRDLLIILQESYDKIGEYSKSEEILKAISGNEPELSNALQLSIALQEGDLRCASQLAKGTPKSGPVSHLHFQYCRCRKSVRRAKTLNALLPGAGYAYVGQKRSAATSFFINAAFIAATWHFFDRGNIGAGLITASLETGWYLGGINGAGLAAKEYNEHLYNSLTIGMMMRNDLFPVLMLETCF